MWHRHSCLCLHPSRFIEHRQECLCHKKWGGFSGLTLKLGSQAFFVFKNVPFSSSWNASRNCSCVFITIGPYHATGSCSGLPETSRKRMPSSPACTVTSSPLSNRMSERLSACEGGAVSSQFTLSVGTASGPDALQNLPDPPKT